MASVRELDSANRGSSVASGWRYRRSEVACVVVLVLVHVAILAYSASRLSPTLDEPAHLAAGLYNWSFGKFDLYNVNPPLVRMVASIPVMVAGYEPPWDRLLSGPGRREEFMLGERFIARNGARSMPLVMYARWACIPFSVVGALCCYCWARSLCDCKWCAVLSLSIWCFEPNIIAHSTLLTNDGPATSLGVAAAYFLYKWVGQSDWRHAMLAGASLGCAALAKLTWVLLFAVWPCVIALYCVMCVLAQRREIHRGDRHPGSLSVALQGAAVILIGLYVLNSGYSYRGSGMPLGRYTFASQLLSGASLPGGLGNRFASSPYGGLVLPFPEDYVAGLDLQWRDHERFPDRSYLRGQWKQGGWWYYYGYGLLVKTTFASQVLVVLGFLFVVCAYRSLFLSSTEVAFDLVRGACLIVPPFFCFVLVSSQLAFNHHVRYVLPVIGFSCVFIGFAGKLAIVFTRQFLGSLSIMSLIGLSVLHAVSMLCVCPHQLAYFNESAGGASNGWRHLLHSNLDWGQELVEVREWVRDNPTKRPVYLLYYGGLNPCDLGVCHINSMQLQNNSKLLSGFYIVSKNVSCGSFARVYNACVPGVTIDDQLAGVISEARQVGTFGYAMSLYRVD